MERELTERTNTMIDPGYKIDRRTLRYQEPKTNVARLVQLPLASITGEALVNAYMADFRRAAAIRQRGETNAQ
jgi:hypothetical protein